LGADFTKNYIFVEMSSSDMLKTTMLVNFARGSEFSSLRASILLPSYIGQIFFSTDRAYDNVYLWNANLSEIYNYHYQESWLIFNTSTVSNGAVLVSATSNGYGNSTQTLNAIFTYSAINETNFDVYSNAPSYNLTLSYPSPFTVSLDDVARGPGVNFTVNNGSLLANYTLQSYDNLTVVLPASFAPKTIYFH